MIDYPIDGKLDPEPGHYYVTLTRGTKTVLLSGPYPTHREACKAVGAAVLAADDAQPGAWFDRPGTCRMPDGSKKGILDPLPERYCPKPKTVRV